MPSTQAGRNRAGRPCVSRGHDVEFLLSAVHGNVGCIRSWLHPYGDSLRLTWFSPKRRALEKPSKTIRSLSAAETDNLDAFNSISVVSAFLALGVTKRPGSSCDQVPRTKKKNKTTISTVVSRISSTVSKELLFFSFECKIRGKKVKAMKMSILEDWQFESIWSFYINNSQCSNSYSVILRLELIVGASRLS